jgi:hypothetical protein
MFIIVHHVRLHGVTSTHVFTQHHSVCAQLLHRASLFAPQALTCSPNIILSAHSYCIVDRTGLHTEIGKASGDAKGPGKGEFQRKIEDAVGLYIGISLVLVVCMIIDSVVVRGQTSVESVVLPILAVVISAVPVSFQNRFDVSNFCHSFPARSITRGLMGQPFTALREPSDSKYTNAGAKLSI